MRWPTMVTDIKDQHCSARVQYGKRYVRGKKYTFVDR